jgi:DNA-binding HxlR family transcriptional regulator
MRWLDYDSSACSVQRTLGIIGEKWTMLLIRDAANGVHRFDDFRRHVGLSEAVLADRLRTLVRAGLFETRVYQDEGQRRRREYRLTGKGWDLFPVLVALMQWGDKHLSDGVGEPLHVVHKDCGHEVEAVVRCTHDHEVLSQYDTRIEPGPGARRCAS